MYPTLQEENIQTAWRRFVIFTELNISEYLFFYFLSYKLAMRDFKKINYKQNLNLANLPLAK